MFPPRQKGNSSVNGVGISSSSNGNGLRSIHNDKRRLNFNNKPENWSISGGAAVVGGTGLSSSFPSSVRTTKTVNHQSRSSLEFLEETEDDLDYNKHCTRNGNGQSKSNNGRNLHNQNSESLFPFHNNGGNNKKSSSRLISTSKGPSGTYKEPPPPPVSNRRSQNQQRKGNGRNYSRNDDRISNRRSLSLSDSNSSDAGETHRLPPRTMSGRGRGRQEEKREVVKKAPILFQTIDEDRMPTDSASLQKRFFLLEKDLKMWNQLKERDPDVPTKTVEKWNEILQHLRNYLKTAESIFLNDTKAYVNGEMDVRVWHCGIYSLNSLLRAAIKKYSSQKDIACATNAFRDLCNAGIKHFKFLISKAEPILNIRLNEVLRSRGILQPRNSSSQKETENEEEKEDKVKKEEDLIYRLFIALGDIHRYSYECFGLGRDHHLSKEMYKTARLCDTSKSRAYYQLAVLAKSQKDWLGMIFYYMRAFSGQPEIDGIKSQLIYVFDDIYHQFLKARPGYWMAQLRYTEKNFIYEYNRQPKHERWILEMGQQSNPSFPPVLRIPPTKLEHLNSLTEVEVENRFSLAVAHFVGMLYTKIGTELLEDVSKDIFIYFEGLLKKNHLKFNVALKSFGLLLFMTDFLSDSATNLTNEGSNLLKEDLSQRMAIEQLKYMRSVCIETILNLLILVCEKFLKTLKLLDWDNPMLTTLSAVVHVWCRWAKRRSYLCSDLAKYYKNYKGSVSKHKESVGEKLFNLQFLNSFSRLYAEIYTLLKKQKEFFIFPEISKGETETCTKRFFALPEQLLLDGFGEVITSKDFDMDGYFHSGKGKSSGEQQQRAAVYFRMTWIILFVEKIFPGFRRSISKNLKSNWNPVEYPVDIFVEKEFNQITFIHERQKQPLRSETPKPKLLHKPIQLPDANHARVIVKNPPKLVQDLVDIRRASQFKTPPISKAYEIWMDLIMRSVKVEVHIRPSHLVLDTNVFINSFGVIKQLIRISPNRLIIPSTVLKELRSLSKATKGGAFLKPDQRHLSQDERKYRTIHAMEVADQCSTVLQFLEKHKQHFRVITIGGNETKMYNFTRQNLWEEWTIDPALRNDEKIMETCMYLELKQKPYKKLESPMRIFRNVVLLTADRSLRVRAYAQDIPARDIYSFFEWYQRYLSTVKNLSRKFKKRNLNSNKN